MSLPESDMAAASLRTCIVCVSCNIDDVVEMLSYSINLGSLYCPYKLYAKWSSRY